MMMQCGMYDARLMLVVAWLLPELRTRSCRIEIAVAHCQLHACFCSHHYGYLGYYITQYYRVSRQV